MGYFMLNYEHFLDEASHQSRFYQDQYEFIWDMLRLSRTLRLVDSKGNTPTLGWVIGFLAYFDLFPSVAFNLDSLADIHQLSGWDDADDYAR